MDVSKSTVGYANLGVVRRTKDMRHWVQTQHQILLTLCLLQKRLNQQNPGATNQPKILLESSYALSSALISLAAGQEPPVRYRLARRLLNHQMSPCLIRCCPFVLNSGINGFLTIRSHLLLNSGECMEMSVHRYEHSERGRELSCDLKNKLHNKYNVRSVRLEFELSEGNFGTLNQALGTRNRDYSTWSQNRVDSLLTSLMTFKTVWPMTIDAILVDGFRTAVGEIVQTEFLIFKRRSYRYYENPKTGLRAIKLRFEVTEAAFLVKPHSLQLILALPSLRQSISDMLNFKTIGKLITGFWESWFVLFEQMWIPKFKTETTLSVFEPIETLELAEMLELRQNPDRPDPLTDEGVQLIQRIAFEITDEVVARPEAPVNSIYRVEPENFLLNRPFLFLLLSEADESQNQLLMMGVCQDPRPV